MKYLQKLGKAIMLPVACLPLCGIWTGIGYLLCPASMQGGEITGLVPAVGLFRLRQHRTIRLRHLPEKPYPDLVTFSCNTQSIPAKNCLYQNPVFLGICSCRIMRYCLKWRIDESGKE